MLLPALILASIQQQVSCMGIHEIVFEFRVRYVTCLAKFLLFLGDRVTIEMLYIRATAACKDIIVLVDVIYLIEHHKHVNVFDKVIQHLISLSFTARSIYNRANSHVAGEMVHLNYPKIYISDACQISNTHAHSYAF